MISEFTNRNLIGNKTTPQGLDSFRRILSISPEQEKLLRSPVHGKCNYISPQSIEIDSVSNDTIPKIATDLRTPKINERRQIEKSNNEETQEILSKVLRVEAELSALKSHVKCELSDVNRKMESLTVLLMAFLAHPMKT